MSERERERERDWENKIERINWEKFTLALNALKLQEASII